MGVSAKTISNWTDQPELAPYFSAPARASDIESTQRDYSTDDILVINTIRLTKTRQNTWRDVAKILSSGHREMELPLSATLTKTISPMDQVASMMAILNPDQPKHTKVSGNWMSTHAIMLPALDICMPR